MVDVTPDPKPVTEGGIGRRKPPRGERRRGRVMATKAQWEKLREEKLVGMWCAIPDCQKLAQSLHHLVPRSLGGDDVADNLVGLCGHGTSGCHGRIEARDVVTLRLLAESLEDAENAYIVGKLGEGALERLFGVGAAVERTQE